MYKQQDRNYYSNKLKDRERERSEIIAGERRDKQKRLKKKRRREKRGSNKPLLSCVFPFVWLHDDIY
jgi:hypothetical protein